MATPDVFTGSKIQPNCAKFSSKFQSQDCCSCFLSHLSPHSMTNSALLPFVRKHHTTTTKSSNKRTPLHSFVTLSITNVALIILSFPFLTFFLLRAFCVFHPLLTYHLSVICGLGKIYQTKIRKFLKIFGIHMQKPKQLTCSKMYRPQ